MSALAHVTTADFQNVVLESDKPVLVDFYADWCAPCRAMGPILEKLASEVGDRATILKVNVEEHPQLAARYRVSGIPMLILFNGGKVASTLVGLRPIAELRQLIDEVAPVQTAK